MGYSKISQLDQISDPSLLRDSDLMLVSDGGIDPKMSKKTSLGHIKEFVRIGVDYSRIFDMKILLH